MGRDVIDWTILDVQAGQEPVGGLGYGIENPQDGQAPHKFYAIDWPIWKELCRLAHHGNVILFERTMANCKGAGHLYMQAKPADRAAIRRVFALMFNLPG